jgi:O-antigen/teichoic acid export membrane protein
VENASGNGASTLQSYSVSSLLGLSAVGIINAAGVLMGPFHIIGTGIGLMTIPEGRKLLRHSPRQLPRFCVLISLGLSLLAAAWVAVLLVGLPLGLGRLMLGALWRPTYPLVLPTGFALLAYTASSGAGIGLHSLGAARHSMRSTLIGAAVGMAFTLIGAAAWGIYGTVIFGGVGSYISTAVSWHAFVKAMQESGTVPVPRWMAVITGRRRAGSRHRLTAKTASRPPTAAGIASAIPDSRMSLRQESTDPSRPTTAEDTGSGDSRPRGSYLARKLT